jgi:hypothetical protein
MELGLGTSVAYVGTMYPSVYPGGSVQYSWRVKMYISGEIQLMVFSACTLGLTFALILWTNSRIDALQKKLKELTAQVGPKVHGIAYTLQGFCQLMVGGTLFILSY